MTIKILGPAGGREAFDAAILAGADEIYMGLAGYGARLYAENFTTDQFIKALYDAHQLGVKLSLTLNTLMSEREVEAVFPDLDRLVSAGLDSVIIQDWGVLRFLKRRYTMAGRAAAMLVLPVGLWVFGSAAREDYRKGNA